MWFQRLFIYRSEGGGKFSDRHYAITEKEDLFPISWKMNQIGCKLFYTILSTSGSFASLTSFYFSASIVESSPNIVPRMLHRKFESGAVVEGMAPSLFYQEKLFWKLSVIVT